MWNSQEIVKVGGIINLLVKFIDPNIEYKSIEIPLKSLKVNLDLVDVRFESM